MSGIKTAGELRGFLADILVGIRDGRVDVEEANAIAKVAGQINSSLAIEAKTAIEMKKAGASGDHVFGSTQIASGNVEQITAQERWCDQCDKMVSAEVADACGSRFCKARAA